MNILIVGCGKVGSHLANYLSREGHDVSIVDKNGSSFDMLDDDFSGFTVEGIPIDQDVLKRAGILGCDAVAALSQDDNVNVMVSQLAREIFHVPRVIARIYDPQRKDVFSHFGLQTICPTNLTVDMVYSILMNREETKRVTFDSSVVGFSTLPVPKKYVGVLAAELPGDEREIPFAALHKDGSITLTGSNPGLRIQATDRLVYAKIVD